MLARALLVLAGAWLWTEAPSARQADGADDRPTFQTHVFPILEAKCVRCHGAQRRDGKLDLRTLDAIRQGGVSGPAIKPGNPTKSLLIELIHYDEMPPRKEQPRVTPAELKLLRSWIEQMPAPSTGS